jgi:hypothetical protein
MKSMDRGFERPAMLAALSAMRLACGTPAKGAENSATLTKKELKTLPASVHTPADRQKLAAHDHDRVRRLATRAQEFSTQAGVL